jgi:hypothetical protein
VVATTYQIAMLPLHHRTVGMAGVEPTRSCPPNDHAAHGARRACRYPTSRLISFSFCFSSSYGSRTGHRVCGRSGLKCQYPAPIDERAVCAYDDRSGSGGARILVSWFSAKRYTVSATDPSLSSPLASTNKKRPDVLRHQAFVGCQPFYGRASQAQRMCWVSRAERGISLRGISRHYPFLQ